MTNEIKLIDGFDDLTQQDIFDLAVAHIGKTGVRSDRAGRCVYSGSGCNAAPLIASGHQRADQKGGWSSVVVATGRYANLSFINDLQDAHDRTSKGNFQSDWGKNMRDLADEYRLDKTKLNEIFRELGIYGANS